MAKKIHTATLTYYVNTIKDNFELSRDSFKETYLAAEELNDLFDQLFTERVIVKNELWEQEAIRMLFGAFSSWVQAITMTAAGLGELGLTSLRRSIEFACYIAKIKNSDDRAELWLSRNEDKETRKRFNGEFGIPRSYFDKKYEHLKSLLVWHDHASDFGAHGNFTTLVMKWREEKNTSAITMSFQDDPKYVPLSIGTTLLIGYLIVEAIFIDLYELINEPDDFRKRIETLKDMLRKSRIEVAEHESGGKVSAEILRSINSHDYSFLNPYYDELKKNCQN